MNVTTADQGREPPAHVPADIFVVQVVIDCEPTDDTLHVRGCYLARNELAVWSRMREIQRTYAPLLAAPPAGTLIDAAQQALDALRFEALHAEIDELYVSLFGTDYAVELRCCSAQASDRIKAQAWLDALEQIIVQEMYAAGRLQLLPEAQVS